MMSLLLLFTAVSQSQETGALVGMTNQHNYYRCLHGSPFIVWDEGLQASAAAWAAIRQGDNCAPVHSSTQYGENLLWSHAVSRVGAAAVDAWYDDSPVNNGRFTPAISDVYAEFYQVIWKSSIKFGCAIATCPLLQDQLVVCHYDKPGNIAVDADARSNTSNVIRLVPECQTIADGHDAGMFSSEETDLTNPGGIVVGALIGSISTLAIGACMFRKREEWKKWTSAKLANQQPMVMIGIQCCLQIATFGLMVRALEIEVVWATLPDGSTFSPKQVCFMRTANGVPGASCTPFEIANICSHEYRCNSSDACAAAVIFLILACVCSWLNLACEVVQVIPRLPLDPKQLIPVGLGFMVAQVVFVWNLLWFLGGYVVSYLSMNGFVMANEGFIEVIVCLPFFCIMLVICSAQMTLNTK